jgi:N-acetylmuramoyl-L-alanine amidase
MTQVRFGLKRWARASRLGLALSLGACLGAAAQPINVPRPIPANRPVSDKAGPDKSDPIGALLARQGLTGAANIPMVIGLKLGETKELSRFTVELSDPVGVRIFTLANPNRVVIDMPDVQWRMPNADRPTGKASVKSYRYGQFRKGNGRFIVDLNNPVKVSAPQMLAPEGGSGFRLLLDLTPTTASDFIAHAGWPADLQTASAGPPPALRTPGQSGKPLIILDPGHGGIDPGTHGQTGIQEKDLVLSVAKSLRNALEASGRYRVQLTRDSDVFIPLRGRVNIARAVHADLFVSLHADSNDRRDIRGASVYTLSEDASDREAATLAEKENMSDVIAGVDLTGENNPVASILIDLAQRDTMNRSVRFAETVLGTLPAVTSIQPLSPHRSAGFAVLKAPDVPAVLIELGYLTNTKDEGEMTTQAWRTRVAGAISAAIDAHFGNAPANLPQQAANP